MSEKRTAVVVATHVNVMEPLVDEAGLHVAGAADSTYNGERLLNYYQPDVMIIENALPHEQGMDFVPALLRQSPLTKVVLIVNDQWVPTDLGSTGAVAVVSLDQVTDLVPVLRRLEKWFEDHPDPNALRERRIGDRRVKQDWSKVGWERRKDQRRREVLV